MDLLLRRRMMMAPPAREEYIIFADPVVEQICATNWGDGVGITPSQAAAVTNAQFGATFRNNTQITSFDEFKYFTSITSLSSANNQGAFYNCTSLRSISTPPSLHNYSNGTFRGCSALEEIHFGGYITGGTTTYLFSGCTSLTKCYFENEADLWASSFRGQINATYCYQPFYVSGSGRLYIGGTELTSLIVPKEVGAINACLFFNCKYITSLSFEQDSLCATISNYAFEGCSGLTGTITIPSSVNSIGTGAFEGCSGLADLIYNGTANVTMDVLFGSGNGTGTLSVGGDLTGAGNNSSPAKSFKHIIVGGNVTITGSGRSLINYVGAVSVRIAGNADLSGGYHMSNKQLASFEFLEIRGTVSGGIFYGTSYAPTSYILHLGYNGVIALTDAGTVAADRASKIYVDSQAVLNQYLADSGWSAYSSKLDLWENYNGPYKNS